MTKGRFLNFFTLNSKEINSRTEAHCRDLLGPQSIMPCGSGTCFRGGRTGSGCSTVPGLPASEGCPLPALPDTRGPTPRGLPSGPASRTPSLQPVPPQVPLGSNGHTPTPPGDQSTSGHTNMVPTPSAGRGSPHYVFPDAPFLHLPRPEGTTPGLAGPDVPLPRKALTGGHSGLSRTLSEEQRPPFPPMAPPGPGPGPADELREACSPEGVVGSAKPPAGQDRPPSPGGSAKESCYQPPRLGLTFIPHGGPRDA